MVERVCTVRAADDVELSYRVWEAGAPVRATVVLFNGVVSHAGWFSSLAEPLAEGGLRVVGADRRGSGLNEVARGDAPSAAVVLDDAAAIIAAARAPGRPLVLVGWCWGAILAVNLAARFQGGAAGLALLTPGLWPSAEIKAGMAARADAAAAHHPSAAVLDSPITDEMFTSGPALEAFIRRDPLKLRAFSPRFLQISTKLTVAAAGRLRALKLPILAVLASRDRATDNAAARAALAGLPGEVRVLELPADHGLHFDAPEALASALAEWIDTLSLAPAG